MSAFIFFIFKTNLDEKNKLREEIKPSSLGVQSCSEMSNVRLDVLFNRLNINAGRALMLAEGTGKPEGRETESLLKNRNAGKQRNS